MHFRKNQPITEVFDPDFHNTFEIPTHMIAHIPPARLNITRLVLCRNYQPGEPASCPMGSGCKFVHVDIEASSLQPHPIHVNYAYRSLDKCSYARLPAGETLTVMAPNERPPVDEVPSERVLVTRGSLMRKEHNGPLSHCAHYYFNRMCNRGERCNFIHGITVDPTVVTDFKRAPARCTNLRNSNQINNNNFGSNAVDAILHEGGVSMRNPRNNHQQHNVTSATQNNNTTNVAAGTQATTSTTGGGAAAAAVMVSVGSAGWTHAIHLRSTGSLSSPRGGTTVGGVESDRSDGEASCGNDDDCWATMNDFTPASSRAATINHLTNNSSRRSCGCKRRGGDGTQHNQTQAGGGAHHQQQQKQASIDHDHDHDHHQDDDDEEAPMASPVDDEVVVVRREDSVEGQQQSTSPTPPEFQCYRFNPYSKQRAVVSVPCSLCNH